MFIFIHRYRIFPYKHTKLYIYVGGKGLGVRGVRVGLKGSVREKRKWGIGLRQKTCAFDRY